MRVLWLCNIMLPAIGEALGIETSNKEGWLTGLSEQILSHEENNIELGICFPVKKDSKPVKGKVKQISYYSFQEDMARAERYNEELETQLAKILQEFQPDIVHAFGTEFPHTLAMTRCIENKANMLIGIQGLCFIYADYYMADLPVSVQKRFLFRDFLKRDNIVIQQKKYVERGKFEIEALQNTGHVTGRTDWDKKAASDINPGAAYHFMNETLRSNFYGKEWRLEDCEKYSIFLSQGNYPIKGLHYLLLAMPAILESFPGTKVYVAGDVITAYGTLMEKIKIGSYGKYCLDLIKKLKLEGKILFTDRLNSEQMCARYLNSHVFLSPSAIENSPNSVGEAMLLGMPVVSSRVGGVHNMLADGEEGFLYPYQDTRKLAESICKLFGDDELAKRCGKKAAVHAAETHNPVINYNRLLTIYKEIEGRGET